MKKFKISLLLAVSFFSFSCINFASENSAFATEIQATNKTKK